MSTGPSLSILSDINKPLIETYSAIRSDWQSVWRCLKRHHQNHSKEYYYVERSKARTSNHEKAAQFIYLNRTCWNGLYRVNLSGTFNVPLGTKSTVIFDNDDFEKISSQLKKAIILDWDFEQTIDLAEKGDLLFIDPPYTINHNMNGFIKYNERIFKWDDQIRLHDCVTAAAARGVKFVVTNANHSSIRKLYAGIGSVHTISRYSVLAASSRYRKKTDELVITSGI